MHFLRRLQEERKKKISARTSRVYIRSNEATFYLDRPEIGRICNLRNCWEILSRNAEFNIAINRHEGEGANTFNRNCARRVPKYARKRANASASLNARERRLRNVLLREVRGEWERGVSTNSPRIVRRTRQLYFIQRGLTLRRQKWNSIGGNICAFRPARSGSDV